MRASRPVVAFLAGVAFAAPLVYLFLLSLSRAWPPPGLLPQDVSLQRWGDVLERRPDVLASLIASILLSLAVSLVSTGAGFIASRRVSRSAYRPWLVVLAYAPFAVAPVILGACLLFFFIRLGVAGSYVGVFLAQLPLAFGFSVVFFLGIWTPRMQEVENVVHTLVGGQRDALLKALVPLSRGSIVVCFFQVFLLSWVQYGVTLVVGQGKVKTLPVKVYDLVFEASPHDAAVVGALLVIPPLLLLWSNRRVLLRAL